MGTYTWRDGYTASDMPSQCHVRANGSLVRRCPQSNLSALNPMAHLVTKILLEKVCLGSLQHTHNWIPLILISQAAASCPLLPSVLPSPQPQAGQELIMGWAQHMLLVCTPTAKSWVLTCRCWPCGAIRGCSSHDRNGQAIPGCLRQSGHFTLLTVTTDRYILSSQC